MPKVTKKQEFRPSRSLKLPDGYQTFHWYYKNVMTKNGVSLDSQKLMTFEMGFHGQETCMVYTHHEVFFQDGIIKHTRSSPNWEGGLVTYCTCKHLMRSTKRKTWVGVWLMGLCPAKLNNAVMFCGRINMEFNSNLDVSKHLVHNYPSAYRTKMANSNPRGDLYATKDKLVEVDEKDPTFNHKNFYEPPNHTRSVEFYKKSSGSVSEREDGKIPKWWRDIEYRHHQTGNRPKMFILQPCFLFSQPTLYTRIKPGRATRKLTVEQVLKSFH